MLLTFSQLSQYQFESEVKKQEVVISLQRPKTLPVTHHPALDVRVCSHPCGTPCSQGGHESCFMVRQLAWIFHLWLFHAEAQKAFLKYKRWKRSSALKSD